MSSPRVLVLCGGRSEEHEVSLSSAKSVLAAAGERFEVTPLVIKKSGELLSPESSRKALLSGQSDIPLSSSQSLQSLDSSSFDVVFPLLHGPYGEDGTVQGFLKLMNLPFVGSDVLGSAVGMDKIMMKDVFKAYGLPQLPYLAIKRRDWLTKPDEVLNKVTALSYPIFIKPANLGSSVGISKAVDEMSLRSALDEAARHDRRIIAEQGIDSPRELEVAILGNDMPKASPVGEISYRGDFYDYATKYTEGCARLDIPAQIPAELAEAIQTMGIEAFEALDGAGLARVDFFYDEQTGSLYINEINTMPGFTTTSMYPKLWEAGGLSYSDLVAELIALGLERR